ETPRGVILGSDSQASTRYNKTAIKGGKIVINGEYGWGLCGLFEMIERLKRAEWPDVEGDAEQHVLNTLIPFLTNEQSKMFEEFGIDEESDNPFQPVPRSSVLLALRGKVYEIRLENGFSPLHREDGKYAIGSGTEYARGALNASRKNDRKVVLSALE